MKTYHKIKTLFARDPENSYKTLLEGQYSYPEFEYLKDNQWVGTEKVDGTNIRLMYDGPGNLRMGGKTDRAQLPVRLVDWFHAIILSQKEKFEELFGPGPACLYGEGYGAGIQKGGSYLVQQSFVLFDVLVGDWWLRRCDVETIGETFNLNVVPIVIEGTLSDIVYMVKSGFKSAWNDDLIAEGIVARPAVEMKRRNGERIITKLKYKDFEGG